MGRLLHTDQDRDTSKAQPSIEKPVHAAAALRRVRLGVPTPSPTEMRTLQRTLGNSAVNRMLQTPRSAAAPVDRGGNSVQPVVIQRMTIEEFNEWFRKARQLDTVEQRHAFLLHALGWQEFGSFQRWLQLTNRVHELFGQDRPQPQALAQPQPQQAAQHAPQFPLFQPQPPGFNQPWGGTTQPQPPGFGQHWAGGMGMMQPQPPAFGQQWGGMGTMQPPQQTDVGEQWGGGMDIDLSSSGAFGSSQMGFAATQLDPATQRFLARFGQEAPTGDEWERFESHLGRQVNVQWQHILNHTYQYMHTTHGKPGHSLFPLGTTADDIGDYIQEAIDSHFGETTPTLRCGKVRIGWGSRKGVDSILTFFPDFPGAHPDKMTEDQLRLLREHLNID